MDEMDWILIVVKRKWGKTYIYVRHIYIRKYIYMRVYVCVFCVDCLIVVIENGTRCL